MSLTPRRLCNKPQCYISESEGTGETDRRHWRHISLTAACCWLFLLHPNPTQLQPNIWRQQQRRSTDCRLKLKALSFTLCFKRRQQGVSKPSQQSFSKPSRLNQPQEYHLKRSRPSIIHCRDQGNLHYINPAADNICHVFDAIISCLNFKHIRQEENYKNKCLM